MVSWWLVVGRLVIGCGWLVVGCGWLVVGWWLDVVGCGGRGVEAGWEVAVLHIRDMWAEQEYRYQYFV